jgi:hypothetical protein
MNYDTDTAFNIAESRNQDAENIAQLRQSRQQPTLIITIISPELHFDGMVGLCVEGSISEVYKEK